MLDYKIFIERLGQIVNRNGVTANEECMKQAGHIIRHEFNVLGSGWVHVYYGMKAAGFEGNNYSDTSVSCDKVRNSVPHWYKDRQKRQITLLKHYAPDFEPIDWQIDIKSGWRYDIAHISKIRFGMLEGVDAKVSADMSRGYQLVTLARAWRETGDIRYRNEVLAQILDWLTVHPPEYGAGWRANMNAAIRVVNWLAACSIISPAFDAYNKYDCEFLDILYESLLEHRRYIGQYLEYPELPNALHPNHYVANLCGLMVLSAFLKPFDPDARPWETLAMRELKVTTNLQINPDGLDFEGTTMYHSFVLEMISYALVITSRLNGAKNAKEAHEWICVNFKDDYDHILYKMFAAQRDLVQQNGSMPIVGDGDSGRFLCLEDAGNNDTYRVFLSAVGAALYSDTSLLPQAYTDKDITAACTLFDEQGELVKEEEIIPASIAFKETGFYIMKTRDVYSFISCGPIGTNGLGSHSHNDRLEVLLNVKGEDIIIDPGVYVYTASMKYRDLFRNVEAHSTVCVNGKQPNRLNPPGCWWGYFDDTKCKCLKWEVLGEKTIFEGEHYGYCRLDIPVVHRRRSECTNNSLYIKDMLLKAKNFGNEMTVDFRFTLGPECKVSADGEKALIKSNDIIVTAITTKGHVRGGRKTQGNTWSR
jgi:hypothetical protein